MAEQLLIDGQTNFVGGMDASQSPELIHPDQYALGINVTTRGNYPQTRPQFLNTRLDFNGNTAAQSLWNSGRFQGYEYYNPSGKGVDATILASVSGHIFLLQPISNGLSISDITPLWPPGTIDAGGFNVGGLVNANSANIEKAIFQQADVYMIIQDNQSSPIIFDGSTTRRAGPTEIPVGSYMAYGEARVVVGQGNQFVVGDINGGATSVLSFTETTYLAGGGAFLLPFTMGQITGMIFNAKQDTNTGQGTLLVFGQYGVISVDLSLPRSEWQNQPITAVTLTDIGSTSNRSLLRVNADVFFRSADGLRSYRDARAEFDNYGRTPLSYEVTNILSTDTPKYLNMVSSTYFDNRLLMTTQPIVIHGVPVFQGLISLDFIPTTANRYSQKPAFDGIWTGLNFYQLLTGVFYSGPKCYAAVQGSDTLGNQTLEIWQIMKDPGADNNTCPVSCAIETKAFTFNNPLGFKRIENARLWLDQLQDRSDFTLFVRPDQYPGWALWQTWTEDAPVTLCTLGDCTRQTPQPQFRPGITLTRSPEDFNSTLGTFYRRGYNFQLRLEWIGNARVTKMVFSGIPQDIPKEPVPSNKIPEALTASILKNLNVPETTTYFNAQLTYACPSGFFGTPVTVPAATFSSTVSLSDANAKALVYAQTQANCIPIVVSVEVDMSGPVDDDLLMQINGVTPTQGTPATIYYWDYTVNDWSSNWTSTQLPTAIPGGQNVFPITSTDRDWNVVWYAGNSYQTQNFIKVKYTGTLRVGDTISLLTRDGFQSQYSTSAWTATITYYNGSTKTITGGTTFVGTTPNLPSPPRYNPGSAAPYDNRADLAAFLGLPDYLSQGYPNSGPFINDQYANGSFIIPAP